MAQSSLRFFQRSRIHKKRDAGGWIPKGSRGLYVLYKENPSQKKLDVVYIGVGGTKLKSGIGARIWRHNRKYKKQDWTHYSVFEVHDNISGGEILELERFLLEIFRSDSRVTLENVQFGSKAFNEISRRSWSKT